MSRKRTADPVGVATQCMKRAWVALAALETARTSEDVDRARHGAQHELETGLRALRAKVPEPPAPPSVRGQAASMIIVDDVLPFDEPPPLPCSGFCGTSDDPEKLCPSCWAEVVQSSRQAGE